MCGKGRQKGSVKNEEEGRVTQVRDREEGRVGGGGVQRKAEWPMRGVRQGTNERQVGWTL